MLTEIRTKSQITIPKAIINSLRLQQGDKLEIIEKDGMIIMIPVSVYPKNYVEELQTEVLELKKKIANGEQPIFDNINDLIADLKTN